jgi:hypothetical protein
MSAHSQNAAKDRRKQAASAVQKYFGKGEKKACQRFKSSINGNLRRQMGPQSRSKIF